ncbi:hypothetical protein [Sphingobacterium zeae]|uniref:hypothetical protein n=1 Tax=Sphingobacterium zeae TaxID=1776859 RepID=UPI0036116E19
MSAEDDRTLVVLHKLSQELCKPWHWRSRGGIHVVFAHYWGKTKYKTYDDVAKDYLPNSGKRLCTEVLKVEPMYNYIRKEVSPIDPVEMRIGFRLDELDRTVNMYFKLVEIKKRIPNTSFCLASVIIDLQIPDYLVKWWDVMDVEGMVRRGERVLKPTPFNYYKKDFYRVPSFPLIEHGITKAEIVKYWQGRPEYVFPPISNCVMCFHHTIQQLQQQWQDPVNWNRMQWADDAEKLKGNTFKRRTIGKRSYPAPMDWIKNLPIQQQLEFIDYSSCDAGSCSD